MLESRVWSLGMSGFEIVDITCGLITILEQMLDHHGFCELEIVDCLHWLNKDSGAIGRCPEEIEWNPRTDVNTPWRGVGRSI